MKRFEQDKFCESMRIRFDYNYMMDHFIGKDGLSDDDIASHEEMCAYAFHGFNKKRGTGMLGWSELPYEQDEVVAEINATAKEIRKKFEYFVVLGIGGSALGPIAVFNALKHLHYNDLPADKRGGPKFYVEDNVDPERMAALLDVIDLDKTMFNVITKSGSTSETMSQYLIVWDILVKKFGARAKDHMIATTSAEKGNLIKLAQKEGLKTFYIPDGVGGRFSELCPVGLLPAAVLGIDIEEMLAGAKYMDKRCDDANLASNPAMCFAVLQYIAFKKGMNISVMMPYADGLKLFADWYCQLWAESLGKAKKLDGTPAFVGQTPVKSLGVTDQHSQVQLYTEGPFDKVITLVAVDNYRKSVVIPKGCEEFPNVNFLCGHTLNELITTEMNATAYALMQKGRMSNTIYLPEINEFTLGQFMFMLELATAYIGEMFGIDAFDQPGVEAGKNATYAMFGRVGYEEKKKELDSAPQKTDKYIC